MINDIEIREISINDAEKLIEYTRKVGGESDNLSFDENGILISVDSEKEFIKSIKDDTHSVMYGVWIEDQLIANCSLISLSRRMSHRAELAISVLKPEWNKGIGNLLISKAVKYAKDNKIEIINLEVRSDNDSAIHLYKKYGFKFIGRSPAFFKIGDEYIDFDLMYLDLR